jgi:hypothetical protein
MLKDWNTCIFPRGTIPFPAAENVRTGRVAAPATPRRVTGPEVVSPARRVSRVAERVSAWPDCISTTHPGIRSPAAPLLSNNFFDVVEPIEARLPPIAHDLAESDRPKASETVTVGVAPPEPDVAVIFEKLRAPAVLSLMNKAWLPSVATAVRTVPDGRVTTRPVLEVLAFVVPESAVEGPAPLAAVSEPEPESTRMIGRPIGRGPPA